MAFGFSDRQRWIIVAIVVILIFHAIECGQRSPLFSFTKPTYVASIPENARGKVYANSDSKIGVYLPYFSTRASDNVQNSVRYKIVSGDKQNFFKAESESIGNFVFLRIRTRLSLDLSINRELTADFSLRVKATLKRTHERNLETWTEVLLKVLDQNDLSPLFMPDFKSVEIDEDFPLYSSVTQMVATDPDEGLNGEIYYSLPERSDYFIVHPNTGVVSLIKSLTFDAQRFFTLKILAEDRASRLFADQKSSKVPSVATVNVTVKSVNRGAPSLSVIPSDDKDTKLCGMGPNLNLCARLSASDSDSSKRSGLKNLEIVSGDSNHWFILTSTCKGVKLDSECIYEILSVGEIPSGFYELNVSAVGDGYPSKNLTIPVSFSVPERCPTFAMSTLSNNIMKFSVDECSPPGTILGFVASVDVVQPNSQGNNEFLWSTKASGSFKINNRSGLLTLLDRLDFETTSNYRLEIEAINSKCSQTLNIPVDVVVIDCNDKIPTFNDFSCSHIYVTSSTPLESVLCTAKASDLDKDLNGRVSYSIHADDKNLTRLFWIDPFNGVLKLRSPFPDEFFNKEQTLKLRASDWGRPYRMESELDVTVWFGTEDQIKPVNATEAVTLPQNRFDPSFDYDFSSIVYVNESSPAGSVVFAIRALDADSGAAGFLRYVIVDGNDDGYWTIESESGYLKPLRSLDREKVAKFTLLIAAEDAGVPSRFARRNLSIELTDSNDSKPKFAQPIYSIHVAENAKIGSIVTQLTAIDDDKGANARVSYSFHPDSPTFSIDSDSGIVALKQLLDREATPSYELNVVASDHGWPVLSSSSLLKIILDDINDNSPECYLKNRKFQVAEDSPVNALITCVDAYDMDLDAAGRVTFRLSETHDPFNGPPAQVASKFSIDQETGCIWLKEKLDYEEWPMYNLSVELTDAGQPQLASQCYLLIEIVNVNENRFSPVFDTFAIEASVYENEPENTEVTVVHATDPDKLPNEARISYSIVSGDGLGFFKIDSLGKIRTSRKLDRETKAFYWLTVVASDHGLIPLSSSIEIFVNVLDRNDNRPIPTRPYFKGSIRENSPANSVVVAVEASDPDTSKEEDLDSLLTYKINQGDPQSFFKIDSKTGYISTDKRQLDRENVDIFELEVVIFDNGVPQLSSMVVVTIVVEDENDCPPKFLNRFNEFRILANDIPTDAFVCRVYAIDLDSETSGFVSYNISEGNEDGRFWINEKTGEIYCTTKLKERETVALTITASDGKFSDETSVVLNVVAKPVVQNNSPPSIQTLSNASFHMSFNEPLGRSVGLLEAADPDGDVLWFYFENETLSETFSLISDSGDLQVAKKPNASLYVLKFYVTDGLHSVPGKITIFVENVPDEKIDFKREVYDINVFENTTIGNVVFELSSEIHNVNADVRYFMASDFSAGSSKFEIDARSGNIYLTEHLDRETTKSYVLMVEARHNRQKIFCLINIEVLDVNDHKPKFVNGYQEIRIQETAPVDSVVAHLLAIDEDAGDAGRLTYKIVGGNYFGFFFIDPQSGHVTVAKQLKSKYAEFVLSIKAEDAGQPSQFDSATLRILLSASVKTFVKFQQDLYTLQLLENQAFGSVVGVVSVESGSGVRYSLEDSNNLFEINPTSGVILLKGKLDFEVSQHLEMLAKAKGATGGEDVARVVVKVLDCNDHSPSFKQNVYEGSVVENSPSGTIVVIKGHTDTPLTVAATDVDSGPSGLVSYRIADLWARDLFDMDYRTGSIRTKKPMDFEKQNLYEFTIVAEDMGEPKLYSIVPALIRIFVTDVNDNSPKFEKDNYSFDLLLPTTNDVLVGRVKANDLDSVNSISYSINNHKDLFYIDEKEGILKIRNVSLLTADDHTYELTVLASDGQYVEYCKAKIVVKLVLTPSREPTFRFSSDEYVVDVLENISTQQTLLVLQTIGSDLGETITYSLLNENPWFALTPLTGLLETTGVALDREQQPNGRLRLIVNAHDQRNPPRSTRCVIEINIVDQNDCHPTFYGTPFKFIVASDTQENAVVGRINVVDLDDAENGNVNFKFGRFDDSSAVVFVDAYLKLDEATGEIRLKRNFTDFTGEASFRLPVIAFDNGKPSLSSTSDVHIVTVSKDTPVFTRHMYNITVPEGDTAVGSSVLNLDAVSRNGNLLGHRIVGGDTDSLFRLDFLTGQLSVQKPLDREIASSHVIKIQAYDVFTQAAADISVKINVIDINDNAPMFTKRTYVFDVKENALIGSKIGRIFAEDKDINDNALLVYSFISATQNFEINSKTGDVFLTSPLNFESVKRYTYEIAVRDSGLPQLTSTAKVIISVVDVNDNAPIFSQLAYDSVLSKNAPIGSFVAQISAADEDRIDNERLIYSIFDGDDEQLFSLDSHTGVCKTSKSLSDAVKTQYQLNLTATDGLYSASCLLSIKIESKLSANAFLKRTLDINVKENVEIGSFIGTVNIQASSRLTYRLLNGGFPFRIDASTGSLYVTDKLDAEKVKFYAVTVLADDTDGANYAGQVKISVLNINDNKPKFAADVYKIALPADLSVGNKVLQVFASDSDENDSPEYSIRKDSDGEVGEKYFKLNRLNGNLEVKRDLRDLSGRNLRFIVVATDQGNPPLNDEVPVDVEIFTRKFNSLQFYENEYSFKISEGVGNGWKVGRLKVNSSVKCAFNVLPISKGNLVGGIELPFQIDENGTLIVRNDLDRELVSKYSFHVGASFDVASGVTVAVTLVHVEIEDVNDNEPKFFADQLRINVFEDSNVGTSVLVLSAVDVDIGSASRVVYSIEDDPENYFKVDALSGWILTAQGLDRETKAVHIIKVFATDEGFPSRNSSIVLEVHVLDVNDMAPTFKQETYEFSVDENVSPGTVIGHVHASDDDLHPFNLTSFYIVDGNLEGLFGIHTNGQVYVAHDLDFENVQMHRLVILVSDGKFSDTSLAMVTVNEIDDTPPVCNQELVALNISETIEIGTPISSLSATDKDTVTNSFLQYFVKGSDSFEVDREGKLSVSRSLDREKLSTHNFVVKVEDSGGRFCEIYVAVNVIDSNDEQPVFERNLNKIEIRENYDGKFPTFLGQLFAMDWDLGDGSQLKYSLSNDVDKSKFSVDSNSGAFFALKLFDREELSVYNITVLAEDNGNPPLSSSYHFLVDILDVNDNPPEFLRRNYFVKVEEDTPLGVEILRVKAISKDFGRNAEIRYHIVEDKKSNVFSLDANTGSITVTKSLDYEKASEYRFSVVATDSGDNPLSGTAEVAVSIVDVNDNSPAFTEEAYRIRVLENQTVGQSLLQVLAHDSDSGENGRVSYAIMQPRNTEDRTFSIEPDGKFVLASSLDYEHKTSFMVEVKAFDGGTPVLSSVVEIHVDVIDVNDNAPVITNCNRTIAVKQHVKLDTVIHTFNTIDQDGDGNAEPFVYELLGAGSSEFKISTAGHLFASVSPFTESQYKIKVTVSDNGKPSLQSECRLLIKIIEESLYPPEVSAFHSILMIYMGEFHGGVVGKVFASDRDAQDQLIYGIQALTDEHRELFDVHSEDGRVSAIPGLQLGHYVFNVTVFDGSFLSLATSKVEVKPITAEMLAASVSAKFDEIDVQTFVQSKLNPFLKRTSNLLNVESRFVHLLSVQSTSDRGVSILFAVRKTEDEFHKPSNVRSTLAGKLDELSDIMRVSELVTEICRKDTCLHGDCRDMLTLDEIKLTSVVTKKMNFISPKHKRTFECLCYQGYGGTTCDKSINACGNKPCPDEQICIPDDSDNGYHCSCPPGRHGVSCKQLICTHLPCPDSALNFVGKSFVRYTLSESLETEMDFSLQFRTTAHFGTLLFNSGKTDFQLLEIHRSFVQYRFNLGSGENVVSISQVSVSDGRWHNVRIYRNQKHSTLSLDKKYTSALNATGTSNILNLHGAHLYLGSELSDDATTSLSPTVGSGFTGCLQTAELNGYRLPLNGPGVLLHNVRFECQLDDYSFSVCRNFPCKNGGLCTPKGSSYACVCHERYSGRHCEVDTNPCVSAPCSSGATCKSLYNDYSCKCPAGLSGKTCHENVSVDPCSSSPCLNGGMCILLANGYICNCSYSWSGRLCATEFTVPNISTSNWALGVTWPELIGIVALLLILIILTIVIVFLCRRRQRYRYKKANYIQNVPTDEIGRDILQPSYPNCRPTPSIPIRSSSIQANAPPPLPPRLRSFVPHRGSKLSNLESALSTGIPTVQVRPLSMSERQSTPPPTGVLEAAGNYGSAAEELERLGRGPGADGVENMDDWKAALQNVNFNDDSLERLKAVATSLESPSSRPPRKRVNAVDPLSAPSVTSIQCLPEDDRISSYHWDYSDWNSTLGQPGGYNTLGRRSEILTDDESAVNGTLPRGVSKLEETDTESVGDLNHEDDNELNELEEAAAGIDEFRQQLLALSRLNRRLGADDECGKEAKEGGSYLDKYLPRLQAPPASTGSERRCLLDASSLTNGHRGPDVANNYDSEWSLKTDDDENDNDRMQTSMEGQLSSVAPCSTNGICEIDDDCLSDDMGGRAVSDGCISPASVKKQTEV